MTRRPSAAECCRVVPIVERRQLDRRRSVVRRCGRDNDADRCAKNTHHSRITGVTTVSPSPVEFVVRNTSYQPASGAAPHRLRLRSTNRLTVPRCRLSTSGSRAFITLYQSGTCCQMNLEILIVLVALNIS